MTHEQSNNLNNKKSSPHLLQAQRAKFSQIIKSKNISAISSLFNDQEFKKYSVTDHKFILDTVKEAKINVIRDFKSENTQNKSSKLSQQRVTLQRTALSSLERTVSTNRKLHHIETKVQDVLSRYSPSEPSEKSLSDKIKSVIEDLIHIIQKFFKSRENTELLEGFQNNIKKYSISAAQDSNQISQSSSTKIPKSKPKEREL